MWTKTHTSSYFLSSVSLSKWALIGCSSNEPAHRGLVKEWGRKAGISSHHPQMLQPDGFWLLLTPQNFLLSEPHFGNNYISCRCCWSTSTECPKMTRKFPSQQLAIELPTWGTAVVDWKRGCPSICILCSIYIYSGPPSPCAAVFAMFAQFIFIAGEAPYSKPPSSCAAHCCAGHCSCWNARSPHQT